MRNKFRTDGFKKPPLWKTVVILVLVVAMPLFFSYYRSVMTQRSLNLTAPVASPATPSQSQKQ
jgi:hypothetical protein